jgi:uncharacterized caspase-like protein
MLSVRAECNTGVRVVGLFLILMSASLPALAEQRIALVIGNQAYDPSVGVLKNPYNDVAVVGQALGRQGFEVLPPIKDAKRTAILGAVRDLVRRLNAAGAGAIGFIYYSGHGAAEKDTNINYLIPIDAKEPGTSAFWDESVKLDDVLRLLDGARAAAKFIVFDACRSELQLPTKDTTKGLVPVAEQQGMFIAYASAPGHTASDRGEGSGPYAAALAFELGKPGLDHLNLFQNVKEAVLAATGGAQQPWESNGLGRRVFLTGQAKPAARLSDAAEAWGATKDTTNIAIIEAFIARYKDTFFADLARSRIDELKKQQMAVVVPPKAAAPAQQAKSAMTTAPSAEIERRQALIEESIGKIIGKWSGSYSCTDFPSTGELQEEVYRDNSGKLVAVDTYHRYMFDNGAVNYEMLPTENTHSFKLKSKPPSYYYEVELHYGEDFKTATGIIIGHRNCRTVQLRKVGN